MHSLDDVSAIVENSAYILSVNCTSEMRVTVMLTITVGCADPLQETNSDEKHLYSRPSYTACFTCNQIVPIKFSAISHNTKQFNFYIVCTVNLGCNGWVYIGFSVISDKLSGLH